MNRRWWSNFELGLRKTALVLCLLCGACAEVPKEVVELSYVMGEDISAIEVSYDELIHQYFERLKDRRRDYLENQWKPRFIGNFLGIGRLEDIAKGQVIWSDQADDFVAPTPGRERQQLLSSVQAWADEAIFQIRTKEAELVSPLDEDERALRLTVAEAFGRLRQANATITAHLNSIREVKELQDELLDAAGLKKLRDRINSALVEAAQKAASGLEQIKKADELLN